MRTMTRPEFEDYEKRVEDVLARIEDSIGKADLEDFGEVAAAAREVVEMRRVYLEIAERQSEHVKERHDDWPTQPAATSERYFEKTAEAANDALNEIRIAREALGKIEANEHSILPASAYRGDLDRGLEMAAKLAVQWNNHHVLEAAQVDKELAERIVLYEKNWEEHDISYGAGSAGEPIPEITKGDAKLLGYYKEGLDNHKSDLAIADAENGLSYGSWAFGPSLGYWSHEDSDAAWENFSQRRNELLAAYTRLEQGAEKPDSEMLSTVAVNDAERAPYSGDDLASLADRSGQTSEAAD